MERKMHLTSEGLLEIQKIANQMNTKANKSVAINASLSDN
jgi:hypothetical protein